jgi:dynein assembly factor 2
MANRMGLNNMEEVKMEPVSVDSAERAREVEFLKNASGDELKKLFREYREGDRAAKLGMTEEEAQRINDCMGKDDFMKLFRDYVDDISDPKNQEEYDQYLRQLEEEGEIPEDEEVVRPTPGFVVKIKSVDQDSKIFVNVCGTPKVPKPSQGARASQGADVETTGSKGDGAQNGAYWSIPYIHTSMRMDQDKDRNPCHVYDILFNDETIKLAESKGPQFKFLVIQTALESVEENGKTKLKNAEGKYDFQIMQKMTYKGKVVRPHKLKKDVLEQPKAPHKPPKNEELKPKPPARKKVEEEDPTKPKMTMVHRGEIELGDYMKCVGLRDLPISRRPKELVIKLELPLMKSAADMDLDIKGGYLEFKAENAGYNLKHKLPYPVDEASGDAKYVKAQKLLTVTLQVLPWSQEEIDAEVARAEAQLAAQRAEEEQRREEARRKAEEEAKRVVKKGFLDKAAAKTRAKGAPAAAAGDAGGDAAAALADLSLEDCAAAQDEAPADPVALAGEGRRPKIEDLGECVPVESASAAAGAVVVEAEEDGGEPFVSFRQNQKNVTAVVRVANIEPATAIVEIQQTHVSMRFSAVCAVEGAAGSAQKRVNFSHTLHLAEDVDPLHSRFDISDNNMVLVMRKVSETRWSTFTGAPREAAAPVASKRPLDAQEQREKAAAAEAAAAAAAAEAKAQTEADSKHVRFGGEMGPTGGEAVGREKTAVREGGEKARQTDSEVAEAEVQTPRRVVGAQGEVFEEAAAFAGSRPGFVFKMGSLGLGYYTDKPLHLQEVAAVANEDEPAPTKLNPDPAPKAAPPPPAAQSNGSMPKLPFNNTLVYDLD